MKSFLKKYQIIIFFALTVILSWYPWYTGGYGFKAAGPSYAGLIVVTLVGGWAGIKEMLRRLVHWRVGLLWWSVALFGPPTVVLLAIGIHILLGGQAPNFLIWKQEPYMVPVLMLILISPVGGAGGEEPFGWRGYAQPKLQERLGKWSPMIASLIIGTVWAIWHLPEFFNPASTQYALGMVGLIPLLITEIANSIFMTWLYNKTGGSVLVAGVFFHLMLDISASTMLVDFTVTGMLAGEVIPPANMGLITVQTVVMATAALLLAIATRGRLGHTALYEREEKISKDR